MCAPRSDNFAVSDQGRLVQRCGMRVSADGVVAIWILAVVEQRANKLEMAKLRCERESQVAIFAVCCWKEPMEIVDAPQSGSER